MKRKNPAPQAESENSLNLDVQIPSSPHKISTSRNEELPKKVEAKENPTEKLLSESDFMDTSPDLNVVLQPSVPVIQTGNISSESENKRSHGLNSPPEKAKETENIENIDEEEDIIQLVVCAYNLNEAEQLVEENFPNAEFNSIVNKNRNHLNFLSKVKRSEIPNIIKSINDLNVVHLRTHPDKKTYAPEKPHHYKNCQVLRQK